MRIEASGQKFAFPYCCVCCGSAADTVFMARASKTKGKKVTHTTTRGWDVPCCSKCLRHIAAKQTADSLSAFIFIALLVIGLWWGSGQHIGLWIFLSALSALALLIPLRVRAVKLRSASCACIGPAVAYLGWYGNQHTFNFSSTEYARKFLEANSRKLVNLTSEGHALLVSAPPRIQATANSSPFLHAPPRSDEDQEVLRCIEHLESAKGPASRRTILEPIS
jgi:hypothetical protein